MVGCKVVSLRVGKAVESSVGGIGMSPRPVVKRVPGASWRRWWGSSSEVWQASMSYFSRAEEGDSGRPAQMTLSGSRGGMKRVRREVGMW